MMILLSNVFFTKYHFSMRIAPIIVLCLVSSAYSDEGFTKFWKDNIRANTDDCGIFREAIRILQKQVEELQNGMNTNTANIEKHSSAIEATSASVRNNAYAIVKHESDIGKMKVDIEANDEEISHIIANIAKNTPQIATNIANLNNHSTAIGNNKAAIEVNGARINSNSEGVANNTNAIKQIAGIDNNMVNIDVINKLARHHTYQCPRRLSCSFLLYYPNVVIFLHKN